MRLRSTLALAVVLAALGAYIYFVESKDIAAENEKKTILSVEADAVTGITLAYGDREIALAKGEGGWRLTRPVDAAADQVAVQNLLRAVGEAEVKKTIDDPPADLAPFGLAPPFVTVTLTAPNAAIPPLAVGKTTQVSASTYARRADEAKVYLTASGVRSGVDKQVKDLRDKTVLSFADGDVSAVTLRGAGGSVELVKRDGTWSIEQPAPFKADNNAVLAMLSTLRNLRATDFANDSPAAADLAAYGLAPPRREVVLRTGADREVRLQVGNETEQGVYVRAADRPTVFVVGKWATGEFDKGLNDLRDKTLLTFDPTMIAAVAVTRADGAAYRLESRDGAWHLAGAAEAPNAATVDAFLGALSRLTGSDVLGNAPPQDAAEFGLVPPALTIAVTSKDGSALGTVRLGSYTPNPPATEHTGQRDGDPAVFQLRDYQFQQLDKQAADFSRPPAPIDADPPADPFDEP